MIIYNEKNEEKLKLKRAKITKSDAIRFEKGNVHEREYFELLKKKYSKIKNIKNLKNVNKFQETLKAMKSGYEVIYGGWFESGKWAGEFDFLEINKNLKSTLGNYSYEVIDTKNSSKIKSDHIYQTGVYCDLLKEAQGVLPENFYTDFFLSYQADQDYTFRSQYLKNVTLSGGSAANIFGNTFINELNGNEGNNHFQGFEGDDFINGGEGQDRAIYQGNLEEYFIIPPFYTDDSSYQIIDILQTRDGTDHLYDIEELDFNGVVHLMADLLELNDRATFPTEFALHAAAPNPFNPTTTLKYDVAQSGRVTITIYNVQGKRVRTLYDDHRSRGKYEISWDGRDMNGLLISTGVYFIQLQSKTFRKTIKVLFLK